MSDYSEDSLVEQPAIELFAELGWETANCFHEQMGAKGTLGRETRADVVLIPHLCAALSRLHPTSGAVEISSVDTVERFQGGERAAIVVGATESDRAYLLTSGDFLLDPRRLTVALSRAKHKMILVASRSVFEVFSPDEETFRNVQLWKNLLRHTCTTKLWEGDQHGHHVVVWGNTPAATLVEPHA